MKKIILSSFMLLLLSGCTKDRMILIPSSTYYPTFNTDGFTKSDKYELEVFVETEEVQGKTITYLVSKKDNMMGFIEDTKKLRSNYNTLLERLKDFNLKIKEQNKLQNEKKPTELK